MESLIVYPKNEKQKSLLEDLLQELKIHFEIGEKVGDALLSEDEFYAKVDKAIQQAEKGKTEILSQKKQREFLGL